MRIGVCTFPTAWTLSPGELAIHAERLGFESIWFAEHSHMPQPQRTPLPGGGDAPDFFAETLDPFVALAAAAQPTSHIRLGTGIALLAQRDPIQFAKEVASLDVISEGRAVIGIGYGWNQQELENHGVDVDDRRQLVEEKLGLARALWSGEVASFSGGLVALSPSLQRPSPVQQPHPPVSIGAGYPHGMRRAAAMGVGWMPQPPALAKHPELRVAEYRKLVGESGDGHSALVSVYGVDDLDAVAMYQAAGVDRVIWWLAPALPDEQVAALEAAAKELLR